MNRYRYITERIEGKNGKLQMVRITMKQSKPSWENLYVCNCKEGWNQCTCDGNGDKRES